MLADRMKRIEPSGIRRIFELMATMENPINFSIGQAHYDPPPELVDAACKAMRDGHNRYTVTQGLPGLNEKILAGVAARWGRRPEASLVTSGVSGGILLAFMALLDPGDEILLPDPNFTMYSVLANVCAAEVRFYDLYPDFRIDIAGLDQLVTDKTKIIFLNSPSNPTGGVLRKDEIQAVVNAAERVGAYVISDEIYDGFVYDDDYHSPVSMMNRVIQLSGYSKTFGVPGWRIGYATGPREALDAMTTLQQFSYVCAPAPFQHAVLNAAFDLDMSSYRDEYRHKRDMLVKDLHPAYKLVPPGGSFYAFPSIPGGGDESAFMESVLGRNILVVPGSAFSRRATHFRLSFAVADDELRRGILELNKVAEEVTS